MKSSNSSWLFSRNWSSLLCITALLLSACNGGRSASDSVTPRTDGTDTRHYLVGTAKRLVSPSQSQIDGEVENRLLGLTTVQNFHLGGFGIGPLQSYPDPINQDLTDPAGLPFYIDEQGHEEHISTRLLLLEDPQSNTRIAFVTLDAVGAGNVIQDGVRAAVATAANLAPENVYFGQTHTHAGPDLQGLWGGVPASWIEDFYAAVSDAATQAAASMQPATLTLQQFETSEFNNYRRPQVFADEDADPTASLLRAYATDSGELITSMMQYNAHPTSVGASNDPRIPHPDYVLGLTDTLEAEGGMALYFNGAIADASGSGGHCDGNDYVKVRCRGSDLANAMLQASTPVKVLTGPLSVRNVQVQLPVSNPILLTAALLGSFNRYLDYSLVPLDSVPVLADQVGILPQLIPIATVAVSRISFENQLEIVTIPGEATNTFGQYIKSLAPDTPMMLLGLTQDSMGYILPEEEFNYLDLTGDTGFLLPFTNYEEWISMGPLTAPLLRVQAYNPLFDAPPQANVPPALAACYSDAGAERCLLDDVSAQLDYILAAYAQRCKEQLGEDNAICGLLALGPLYAPGGLLDVGQLAGDNQSRLALDQAMQTPQGQQFQQLLDAILAPLNYNLTL